MAERAETEFELDWEEFKKIGVKGIIITLIVISGTYLCSAAIAHLTLVATGMV